MVGIVDDISTVPPAVFQEKGDITMMIGETYAEYGGSEYAESLRSEVPSHNPRND